MKPRLIKARAINVSVAYDPEAQCFQLEHETVIWHNGEPFTTDHGVVKHGLLYAEPVVPQEVALMVRRWLPYCE